MAWGAITIEFQNSSIGDKWVSQGGDAAIMHDKMRLQQGV